MRMVKLATFNVITILMTIVLSFNELVMSVQVQDCIMHPDTSVLDLSVEEHEIYTSTQKDSVQDPVDYWWRYEIFFQKPDINCSIVGEELKVYIHAKRGGIAIDGQVSRLKYPGERWGEWSEKVEEKTDAGQQFPDPYPDPPSCEVFLRQSNEHRARSGTLYEYGVNRYCHVNVTLRSAECIIASQTIITADGTPQYTTQACEDKWDRHVVIYSTTRLRKTEEEIDEEE